MRTTTTNRVSQADRIAEAVDLDLLPPSPPICMAVELYAKYMVAKCRRYGRPGTHTASYFSVAISVMTE
jgi:hypothetical protein